MPTYTGSSIFSMKLVVISILILIRLSCSFLISNRYNSPVRSLYSLSTQTFLRANEGDDETPRLQYVEAANQPTISVLTDDELKEKRKPPPTLNSATNKSPIKKSSTFGSLSVNVFEFN